MTEDHTKIFNYLRDATAEVVKEQVHVAEIPCPDYRADARAAYLVKQLRAAGLKPRRDRVGNVIAVRHGARPKARPALILCPHLDSVFKKVPVIRVRRRGSVYHAPGICDDASGVANLIVLARALNRFGVETEGDVVLVGSVGEESGEDVWGMEHFWKENRFRNPWFVGIDGAIPGRIVTKSLGTWSPTITVRGPGGHSYVTFGRPNPVHMLSRIVVKLTTIKAKKSKDAIYNANMVSGGTAPNVIPQVASVTLNLRSSDMRELDSMKRRVMRFIKDARREELAWSKSEKWLKIEVAAHGRPGGRIAENHPLVRAAAAAMKAESLAPAYTASSTDANMPMSLGIPAITISSGGRAENMHSLDEWHDMRGRTKELTALARILLAVAG
jgi:acetylornithine deacetylase/succinyl-diaminopimelate desuccinylase-like protein